MCLLLRTLGGTTMRLFETATLLSRPAARALRVRRNRRLERISETRPARAARASRAPGAAGRRAVAVVPGAPRGTPGAGSGGAAGSSSGSGGGSAGTGSACNPTNSGSGHRHPRQLRVAQSMPATSVRRGLHAMPGRELRGRRLHGRRVRDDLPVYRGLRLRADLFRAVLPERPELASGASWGSSCAATSAKTSSKPARGEPDAPKSDGALSAPSSS